MIPILTLSEIKDVERRSSDEHGLTELDMIMSAGEAVFQSIKEILEEGPEFADEFDDEFDEAPEPPEIRRPGTENTPDGVIAFVCGKGHNGADALSAALLTAQAGFGVVIYQIDAERFSEETRRLHEQLAAAEIRIHTVASPVDLPVFTEVDLIVDGLLGSGIKGPPEGLIQS
jgi:NAD(P)H-hydrate repair Nnr-like enzyme with NAD(P)H-hydrate epimerase domain